MIDEHTWRLTADPPASKIARSAAQKVISSTSDDRVDFIVLPECSVTLQDASSLVTTFRNSAAVSSALILGLEVAEAPELLEFCDAHSAQPDRTLELLRTAARRSRANVSLVALKPRGGQTKTFVQIKLFPSRFESRNGVPPALRGDCIHRFIFEGVSFIVLACSDLISRPTGRVLRTVDIIDFCLLKRNISLDFLFNIQHNPSPDHHGFHHSLSRLYDDGTGLHSELCVVLLNAYIPGSKVAGGHSKVLFHKNKRLQPFFPVKQLPVPVVGYELPAAPCRARLLMHRLPKHWERHETCPVEIESTDSEAPGSPPVEPLQYAYIFQLETQETFDTYTYKALVHRYASLGMYTQAVEAADRAAEESRSRGDYLEACRCIHICGNQHRHFGYLSLATRKYHEALSLAADTLSGDDRVEAQLTLWRLKGGLNLVENTLINCDYTLARKNNDRLVRNLQEFASSRRLTAKERERLKIYRLHAERQIAESRRMQGFYLRSFKDFRKIYGNYRYWQHEAKAMAALGMAESLRMLGQYDKAQSLYDEVWSYGESGGDERLKARLLRMKIELVRAWRGTVEKDQLEQFKAISRKRSFIYGLIYAGLISASLQLSQNPDDARQSFRDVLSFIRESGHQKLEVAHAELGIAESFRMVGDGKEACKYYRKCLNFYSASQVSWGVVRAIVGLRAIDGAEPQHPKWLKARIKGVDQILLERPVVDPDILVVGFP
ncbi:MAG: hypothetical protein GC160_15685 [Acidobacteria bacterium]|nr:hypothetical protein [Acidobacteriota bacterium]